MLGPATGPSQRVIAVYRDTSSGAKRRSRASGFVHCPICDAFEIVGQRVALIASGKCRVKEALLLRAYTADLTVLTLGKQFQMSDDERRTLVDADIRILEEPAAALSVEGD